MSKIRINELARELEVKPNVILELLPELGVTDKKTHSSSLDDDVALEVRRRLGGSVSNGAGAARAHAAEHPEPELAPEIAGTQEEPETARPQHAVKVEPVPQPEPVAAESPKESVEETPPPRPVHPLRPPLASQPSAPAMPVIAPQGAPRAPSTPAPSVSRGSALPAKPVPSPRPGQILSGPRQPLPPGLGEIPKAVPPVPISGGPRTAPAVP
ncbi:MAG TPA: translation initiation factor IF-2 N-terminal domain-containing protein, partial [Bryobacteraceae bacterium]|nr:translation initiation factor IF-2 N-terminal domain-containing protein [Bryobacteraceae bacterium]